MDGVDDMIAFVGPMFSGKTSRMLLELERFRHARKEVLAFKPDVDSRYSASEIVTHDGRRQRAISVSEGYEISQHVLTLAEAVNGPGSIVVAVDELFMISGAAEELVWLFRQGVDVVVASLDLSRDLSPLPEIGTILPWATRIERCLASCTRCGGVARYSYRRTTDDDDQLIVVGGAESYEALCGRCHPSFPPIDAQAGG